MNDIEKILNELDKRVEAMQTKMFVKLRNEFLNELEYDKDKILQYSDKNLEIISKVEQLVNEFTKESNAIVRNYTKQVFRTMQGLQGFEDFATPENTKILQLQAVGLLEKLGIDAKGNMIPNGYLASISSLRGVSQNITDYLLREISVGRRESEILKGFQRFMVGDNQLNGEVTRYFKTQIHDVTWNISRSRDYNFAKALNLNYFIYQGTEIDTSREFCKERIGNTYHVNDVTTFPKTEPYFPDNYDFFIHCGGYNCRHRLRWISNELGAKLRKP
jgi:hypothetical protein